MAKVGQDYVVSFGVRNGDGSPRTGLVAGDFTVTIDDPDASASTTATVSEVGNGTYRFTIPSAFTTANGVGNYSAAVRVTTTPLDSATLMFEFTATGAEVGDLVPDGWPSHTMATVLGDLMSWMRGKVNATAGTGSGRDYAYRDEADAATRFTNQDDSPDTRAPL